jgi:hypothetical protein
MCLTAYYPQLRSELVSWKKTQAKSSKMKQRKQKKRNAD